MRKYLNTAEDVIKALRDGKEVKLEEGSGKIYLIDGLVVKENIDGFHINYTINQRDKPYIEEEDKLKLKAGKLYKTRDGRKAFVYLISNNHAEYSVENNGAYYECDLMVEVV